MKYKACVLLAALTALQPATAAADSEASMSFTIQGTAEQVCIMPDPTQSNASNASFGTGNTITVDEVIDDSDGTLNDASLKLSFKDVMCNYPARVVLRSEQGALVRTTNTDVTAVSGSGQFKEEIDYRVIGNWGSVSFPEFSTADGGPGYSVEVQASGANKADMNLDFIIDGSDEPVLLGSYKDTFVIEVGISP
jgi:hypothetical protein